MTKEYLDWFNRLYYGTTSRGRQKLYGKTETLSLVKVFHPGYYQRYTGFNISGVTKWAVVVNFVLGDSYGFPEELWSKEGRLSKEDKKYIEETFGIKYTREFTEQRNKQG